MANAPKSDFALTQQQEAELQASAVIIRRIEASLWKQWELSDGKVYSQTMKLP